jgi:hypothetical protein
MWIDEEKTYGELMSFLLQKKRHHGTDERFKAYIAEAVQVFARDLRDVGLEVSITKRQSGMSAAASESNRLRVSCE